jgi:oligopeptide/dipeptide ABC transporter ATP-binding protein
VLTSDLAASRPDHPGAPDAAASPAGDAPGPSPGGEDRLLDVRDLVTEYAGRSAEVRAVDAVSFSLRRAETVGLVGESGCGKSTVAASIARLVSPPGEIVGGEVLFDGRDLLGLPERQMRRVRGREIGFVFQDPMSSLNPLHTVGHQICETMILNLGLGRREAEERAVDLLDKVGMARPRELMAVHPHQLSGGMQQRVMIAIALACNPKLLIADEPTTALDVTVQAQILELIRSMTAELGTAVLLITHNLGIAAGLCDRVIVMYAGRIVEEAGTFDLFERPAMPYTSGLLDSLPRMDDEPQTRLRAIPGVPPKGGELAGQCRFAPRCGFAHAVCREGEPELTTRSARHLARCFGTEPGGWAELAGVEAPRRTGHG